jgi:hypothetical protein
MLAADGHRTMPEGATVLEIPFDRPAFVIRPCYRGPPAATTVFLPPETPMRLPPVYINVDFAPNPELEYHARRMAYAYITPADAPCRAEPCPFIHLVFRTLALDLPRTFELCQVSSHGADVTMHFQTPDDREAAMRRQPFVLDGATVKFLRDGETPDVQFVPDRPLLAPIYRWPGLKEPVGFDTYYNIGIRHELVLRLRLHLGLA